MIRALAQWSQGCYGNYAYDTTALYSRLRECNRARKTDSSAHFVKCLSLSRHAPADRKQIHDLAACQFIRDKADVLMLGPPGVGKTFLVLAIGHQAIKAGFLVLYRSIFDLARYLKPDLLIIDDMGMKQLPRHGGECLPEIIMPRHENRSTMMTSTQFDGQAMAPVYMPIARRECQCASPVFRFTRLETRIGLPFLSFIAV